MNRSNYILYSILIAFSLFMPQTVTGDFPINVKATYPQVLSAEIGVILGEKISYGYTVSKGFILSVEPGIAGTKLHFGYGGYYAGDRLEMFSGRITATYMRATQGWGRLNNGDDYMGVQLTGSGAFIVGSVGYLQNTSGKGNIVTAGIGLGW